MNANWRRSTLGEVVTLQRGYDLPSRDRRAGTFPIVSSSGVTGYHDVARVSGPGVVTGRYGTLGEVFYVERDFWPLNTTLFVRDFKGNDPRFIGYFLRTLNLAGQNAAGAVPGLNRNALHLLPVAVPCVQAQQWIAGILSTYDELIENNARRIAILEEMARSVYREWIVEFRFPGSEHPSHKADGGSLSEGWQCKKLGEIASEIRQSVDPGSVSQETPYVGLEHLPRRSITLEDWGKAEDISSTKLVFNRGDILFGKIRPYFHKVVVAPIDGICSSDTIVIRANKDEHRSIVLSCVSSDAFVQHATLTSQGTKMPRANWNVLAQYEAVVPPDGMLTEFNSFHNNAVVLVQNLMFQNRALRETRDLLLPRLMDPVA